METQPIVNLGELAKFLVKAKINRLAVNRRQRPGIKEFTFTDGDFEHRDLYHGFYQFQGQEIVKFQGLPVWAMAYNGGMMPDHHGQKDFARQTFNFLKEALIQVDVEVPFRGPREFIDDEWYYCNHIAPGENIERFQGIEWITHERKRTLYILNYFGGLLIPK